MIEYWSSFPRKWSTILSEITLTIQALIEGIKKTAIEYLVKTFQQFELVLEDDSIRVIEMLRNFNHDRFLF